MNASRRILLTVGLQLINVILTATGAAATIYESGLLGTTGFSVDKLYTPFSTPDSPEINILIPTEQVNPIYFFGARFQLNRPVVTSRVGGHFVGSREGDSIFGAIVTLSDESDLPDSFDLSTPDVLGTTVIELPTASDDVFGELELALYPGWYAVIFGSALFGAEGESVALRNNPAIGTPSFLYRPNLISENGWGNANSLFLRDLRFVVEGAISPEPSTAWLMFIGLGSFCFRQFQFVDRS